MREESESRIEERDRRKGYLREIVVSSCGEDPVERIKSF